MNAPEKLYISKNIYSTFMYQVPNPDDETEVEYTRTDALIDKAEEKAKEYSFNIESILFQSLNTEQQKMWKAEIEQAYMAGTEKGFHDGYKKATQDALQYMFNNIPDMHILGNSGKLDECIIKEYLNKMERQ